MQEFLLRFWETYCFKDYFHTVIGLVFTRHQQCLCLNYVTLYHCYTQLCPLFWNSLILILNKYSIWLIHVAIFTLLCVNNMNSKGVGSLDPQKKLGLEKIDHQQRFTDCCCWRWFIWRYIFVHMLGEGKSYVAISSLVFECFGESYISIPESWNLWVFIKNLFWK